MRERLGQLLCLLIAATCFAGGGATLPWMLRQVEQRGLRYTDEPVDGAPPWVAIGTAIGALRGLIVDILWLKVNLMKERGLFYEVMADAELITKLQPRFAAVWAFHGHNMAYNISVATHTEEERWNWVQAGIRLVRNQGLRHNPNDVNLHRELAFWYAHKIEGYADDAHLFYKRNFAQEWHFLLGRPPEAWEDRVAWIRRVADAPGTLEELQARMPEVRSLITRLEQSLTPFGEAGRFSVSRGFLMNYALWEAVTEKESAAELLGIARQVRQTSPFFDAFNAIAEDESLRPAWDALLAFIRRRVLLDEYNMDPRLMYEFTRDLGPIDWRHGQAHALYWSRRGTLFADTRSMHSDELYRVLNTDRLQLQAMQDLARWGRITFDPFSSELPVRFPDPRWIDTIDRVFAEFYTKYYDARGAGGETFMSFLENFMSSAVREAYRGGDWARAQSLLNRLDERFGRGLAHAPNNKYNMPLDVFVREQIRDEYQSQPHLAPSEAVAAMRAAFRMGVANDNEELYQQAVQFVQQVITIFKENEYYRFTVQKFGVDRMADLMHDFPTLRRAAFGQLMTDPSIQLQEKATIWSRIDRFAPGLRATVYDDIMPGVAEQLARSELSQRFTVAQLFPEPPGLREYRALIAEELRRQREAREGRSVGEIERR
ncbi:MAG: hypothetical protein KF817_13455 [Phycisphaeraceae bacterium]|nr:hypothetical protein [Phycisphaeraceae bacterium]